MDVTYNSGVFVDITALEHSAYNFFSLRAACNSSQAPPVLLALFRIGTYNHRESVQHVKHDDVDGLTSFTDESTSQFATNTELQHDEYQRESNAQEHQADQRISLKSDTCQTSTSTRLKVY